jgi:hypothetical protein
MRTAATRRPAGRRPESFFSGIDVSGLPHLAGIGDQWPVLAGRDTYPQALSAFVDGLLAQAT